MTMVTREITIWTVATCCPDENEPVMPDVYGSEAEAWDGFNDDMRHEWQSMPPIDDETEEEIPFPEGDPEEAHRILAEQRGEMWGRYKITPHTITIAMED